MTTHGLLLLSKPVGWTSHDLVAKVRHIFGQKSVGHCGTLDPLASGLMVLLLGEATKLSQYILEGDKAYIVKAKLGVTFDTLDTTGTLLSEKQILHKAEEIRAKALSLTGEKELPVPLYSAVKVAGKRLHEYAREGVEVETPRKVMNFWNLAVLGQGSDWIQLKMDCTKGSYIRAWVSWLGEELGCGAAMQELERTFSTPYRIEQAIDLETLKGLKSLSEAVIPMQEALPHYRSVRVQGQDQQFILNGQISHGLKAQLISMFKPGVEDGVKVLSRQGEMLALVGLEPGKGFVVKRVFRY